MDQKDIKNLLQKYHDGDCSEEEKTLVESYYLNYNFTDVPLLDDDLDLASKRVIERAMKTLQGKNQFIFSLPLRIATVAASIVIVWGVWTLMFTPSNKLPDRYANDVEPGSNKAILTLANGTRINLSDAKDGALASQAGIEITKSADGTLVYEVKETEKNLGSVEYNTISTPRGGQYQIKLPDGSKVWLNAASSLTYSTTLNERGVEREVKLDGEAYFEVSKDPKHPFVVSTDKQAVKVLGTHFNVNAYKNELYTKTTLLEGSVLVTRSSIPKSRQSVARGAISLHRDETILKPNQQALLKDADLQVREVDTDNDVAWKNGEFMFRNEELQSIMRKVARWYDVEVVYEDNEVGKRHFGGTISRYGKVSDVLCMLELTNEVKFKIEGRRISVMK